MKKLQPKMFYALIMTMFSFTTVNAQIAYTDIPDSVRTGSYNVDLNNDGVNDFTITQTTGASLCGHSTHYINIIHAGSNQVVGSSTYVSKLAANSLLNSSSSYINTQLMLNYHWQTLHCPAGAYAAQGSWYNAVDGYLGVKLISNGNSYYGWLRINTSSSSTSGATSFTLKDYAFNPIPNQPILAGETTCTTPTVNLTQSGSLSFCAGDSVTFTANGTGYQYQWKKNNVNITGATAKTYTAKTAGVYKCKVTNSCGTKTSGTRTVTVPCRMTNENIVQTLENFSVYRNSTNSITCIKKQNTLGGSGDETHGITIVSTGGAGFATCGNTNSADGDFNVSASHANDAFVAKYNSIGHLAWAKTFGGSDEEMFYSMTQTYDGGYIATGWTASNDGDVSGNHGGDHDIWVVKLDASGNLQWQKCFGGTDDEYGLAVVQTPDGKYVIGGITNSTNGQVTGNHGDFDIWILKLSSSGVLLSKHCYGGSSYDEIDVMLQKQSGNIFFSGITTSNDGDVSGNHGGQDAWLVKLNLAGNIVWQKSLGGSADDYGYAATITKDGNIVAGSFSFSTDGDVNGTGMLVSWFTKVNPVTGNTIWSKSHSASRERGAFGLFATNDGGMIEVGAMGEAGVPDDWDALVSKWNVNGDEEWYNTYGGSIEDDAISGFEGSNGSFTIMCASASTDGDVENLHGGLDIWLLKLNSCGNQRMMNDDTENNSVSFSTFPNPFSNSTTISFSLSQTQNLSLKVFDLNGRLIKTLADNIFEEGSHQFEWNVNNINAGIYFLKVQTGEFLKTEKLIVTK